MRHLPGRQGGPAGLTYLGDMGILGRLSSLIKSNVNDAIDSMQDPGKEIDQMVRDMEDYARQARAEVGLTVKQGVVTVRDFGLRKNVTVRARHKYLARPPKKH